MVVVSFVFCIILVCKEVSGYIVTSKYTRSPATSSVSQCKDPLLSHASVICASVLHSYKGEELSLTRRDNGKIRCEDLSNSDDKSCKKLYSRRKFETRKGKNVVRNTLAKNLSNQTTQHQKRLPGNERKDAK